MKMLKKVRKLIHKVRLKIQNYRQYGEEEEITLEISGGNCRVKTKHEEFRVEVKLCKSVYRIEKISLDNSEEACTQQNEKDYSKQTDCYNDLHETKVRHNDKRYGITSCTDECLESEVNFCINGAGSKICHPSEEFKVVSDSEVYTSVTPCQHSGHDVTQLWNNLDWDKESNTSERNISIDGVSLSSCSVVYDTSSENGDCVTDNLIESESVFVKEVHSGSNFPEERNTLLKRLCPQSESIQQAGISEWVNESQVITRNSDMQPNLETFDSQRVEGRSQSYEFLNLQSLKEQEKREDLKSECSDCPKTSSCAHKCMEDVPEIDFNITSSFRNCCLSLEDNRLVSSGSLYENQMSETKLLNEKSSHQLQNCDNVVARMELESSSEQTSIVGPEENCQQSTLDVVESQENILPTVRGDEAPSSWENCHPTVLYAEESNGISLNLEHQESLTCKSLVKCKEEGEWELNNLQEFTAVSVKTVFAPMKQIIVCTYQDGSRTEMFRKLKLKIVLMDRFVHMADVWTYSFGQNIYNCFTNDMHPKCGSHDPYFERASSSGFEGNNTPGNNVEINEDLLQLYKNEMISSNHFRRNAIKIFCNEIMIMKAVLSTGRLINHDCLTLEMEKLFNSKGPKDYMSRNNILCLAGNYIGLYVNTQGCLKFKRPMFCNLRTVDIVKYWDSGAVLQMLSLEKNHIYSQMYPGLHKSTIQVVDADHQVDSKLKMGMVLPEISLLSPLFQVRIQKLMFENYNTGKWKCYESGSEMKLPTGADYCMLTDMAETNTLLNVDWMQSLYKRYAHAKKMLNHTNKTWDQFECIEDILLLYGQVNLMDVYLFKESYLPFKPATCYKQQKLMCRSSIFHEILCQLLHRNVQDFVDSKKMHKSSMTSNKKSDNYSNLKETLSVGGHEQLKIFLSFLIFGKRIQKVDSEEITSFHQGRQQISSETLNCDSGEDFHKRIQQNNQSTCNHNGCVQSSVQCGNIANVNYSNGAHRNEDVASSLHVQEEDSSNLVQEDVLSSPHVQVDVPFNSHVQDDVPFNLHVQEDVPCNSHVQEDISSTPHVQKDVPCNLHIQEDVSSSPHVQEDVPCNSHIQEDVSSSQQVQKDVPCNSHIQEDVSSSSHVQKDVPCNSHIEEEVSSSPHVQEDVPCNSHIQEGVSSSQQVQEDVQCNSHVQGNVSSSPHVQENVSSSSHVQEDVLSIQHVQENVPCNTHVQEDVSSSPHVQEDVSSSLHVHEDVLTSQHVQEDVSSSPHVLEDISSSPPVQEGLSSYSHVQGDVPHYLPVQEDIPSSPHIQEDIGALISESTSHNYSPSSSSLPAQYVIYLRLTKISSSVSQNQGSEDVRIRAPRNLNAEEMEKIRMGTTKFFRDYYKSPKCQRNLLPSMQEVEIMSIPDLLFLVQSIPKGLSFLHTFLKISSELRIDSLIEVHPIERQQGTVLDNFLQQVINGDEEAVESRMRLEWFRIITFQTYPANVGISTIKLANNGFYYTGHTIETRCYFCRQTYNEWSAESDIEAVHQQISPDCPFINGRQTNNVPIHGSRRNNSPILDSNVDDLPRAATEHLRNPNVGRTGASSNTMDLPQDQARQTPQPAPHAEASADAAGVDQGTEQEPASLQTPSKSKLKRDKKKKKKEEQAKAKAAASASQGADGSVVHEVPLTGASIQPEPSVTSTSISSEPASTPGLTTEEIQPHSRPLEASPGGEAQATIVSIAPSVPPASTQSRQSSQTSNAQSTTNTSLSASSSASRQGGANPPGPPQSGANPPAPTSAERLAQLDPLGINFDKPKYPAYAVYSTRLSSFDGWPSHMAQTPREMARAGYFYAGYGDYARCFFCGGGLRNWDRTDEPWMEHAKWFPRCAFLRNNKGDKYVARVQQRHQEQEAGLQPSSQLPPPVERDEETAIAQALREMGYNNQIIQRAMNDWRRNLKPGRRHPPPMTASAILDIIEILDSQEQANTERTQETPLTIPGMDSSAVEVNRVNSGNVGESMTSLGASALEENRTDARLDDQPREYGYDQREKQEKQILQEDFLGLTETIVCKVCCDKDVAAAFLPCGHLVCCLDCAPAMRKCPLCAELIKGTVKTYFA